jgi:transcriptional regulator of acetoin/glycerol metabolism
LQAALTATVFFAGWAPGQWQRSPRSPASVPAGGRSKAEVLAMLEREAGSVARAARAFNMNRTAFYRLMWSLGLKKCESGGK